MVALVRTLLRHDGSDSPHGLLGRDRTNVGRRHQVDDGVLRCSSSSTSTDGWRTSRPMVVPRSRPCTPPGRRDRAPCCPSPRWRRSTSHATVTPRTGLHDGRDRDLSVEGLHPGQGGQHPRALDGGHLHRQLGRLQLCPRGDPHPDPTGSGSVDLDIGTGVIGNGVCDATHEGYVVVNNASSTDPAGSKVVTIWFSP